ncbi:MAG: hypothetical protein LBR23_05035 [Spirochaetaceae bacterium]|jgi:hypothetical protein|nr:hypothetical protein [Spirochaetaceae bacterium]
MITKPLPGNGRGNSRAGYDGKAAWKDTTLLLGEISIKTKSNIFKAIIGMACALVLVTGFTACGEVEFGATVTVSNNPSQYKSTEYIMVEITHFGIAFIAPGESHTFEYDWKGIINQGDHIIEGCTIKVFTGIGGSSDNFNSPAAVTETFDFHDGEHITWYWQTKGGGTLSSTPY